MSGHRQRLRLAHALSGGVLVLACLGAGRALAGDQPVYTLDNDPLRLGRRELAAGSLAAAGDHFAEAVAAGYRLTDAHRGLAEVALRQGRLDDAEQEYRQAITAAGENVAAAQAGLGVLLLRRQRPAEARPLLEQAAAVEPDAWLAQYGLARLELAAGETEAAAQRLASGRQRRGVAEGEDLYQHGQALLLLDRGDLAGAETAALRAMHLDPGNPEHAELVARIEQERGLPKLAIQAYEQALAAPGAPVSAPLLHQLGNLYRDEQRFNDAHQAYLRAVAADSTYAPVLGDLADLLRRADRTEPAARTYLRYLETAASDTTAWIGLAEVLEELGRHDEAADAAAQARQLDPASEVARLDFARAAIQGTDPAAKDEAAAILLALPRTAELDASELLALAGWQMDHQAFTDAAATLDRAAAADSTRYEIPFRQGVLALRTGQAEAAVAAFERAGALAPRIAGIQLNLGIALYRAGRLDDATLALRRAGELDPQLVMAHLMLAQTLAAQGQIAAAEVEYRQVLADDPHHAQALRGLGFCRLRQADYVEAARFYGAATEAEPANADGWAGLGSARLGQNQLDAAAAAFERARALDPQNAMLQSGTRLLDQARNTHKENESR